MTQKLSLLKTKLYLICKNFSFIGTLSVYSGLYVSYSQLTPQIPALTSLSSSSGGHGIPPNLSCRRMPRSRMCISRPGSSTQELHVDTRQSVFTSKRNPLQDTKQTITKDNLIAKTSILTYNGSFCFGTFATTKTLVITLSRELGARLQDKICKLKG